VPKLITLSINALEVVKNKNERQPFGYLPLCTQDDSVLELFYKDLVQLYDLKDVLKHEGLSDYATNHHISQDSPRNSTLQVGS
jgi:hypothetical protein